MSHNLVFNEGFETATTGYQETWSLTNQGTGGSENAATAVAAAGSPSGWGAQCLTLNIAAGLTRYVAQITTRAVVGLSHDLVLGAESLADSEVLPLILGADPTLTHALLATTLVQTGGLLYSQSYLYYDGTIHQMGASLLWSTGVRRRFETVWNNTGNAGAVKVNSRFQGVATTLTTPADGYDFGAMIVGTSTAAPHNATVYVDRVRIDTAAYAGYPDIPLVGSGGGYVGHGRLVGLGNLLG